MIITDYDNIVDISFIYPDVVGASSKEVILNLIKDIKTIKNKICDLREEANILDKDLKEKETELALLEPFIKCEYQKLDIKDIKTDPSYSLIGKNLAG